jgi:hypothetical protein
MDMSSLAYKYARKLCQREHSNARMTTTSDKLSSDAEVADMPNNDPHVFLN